MIPCLCINDRMKPSGLPQNKWVVKDEEYRITYVCRAMPQNVLAYSLYEKPLDKSCYPYEYFLSDRFSVRPEDVQSVIDMYMELGEDISEQQMKELLENSELITNN